MTDSIKNKIEKLEAGYIFTTAEFEETAKSLTNVSKILNGFVEEGVLRKLSKVRFYKPKIGKFGELPRRLRSSKRFAYQITFIKQRNTITKENISLLKLLDCLRFFKIIPDAMPDVSCRWLLYLLSQLDDNQRNKLKKFVVKYTPQAIALLCTMLETLNPREDTTALFKMLNPMTCYKLGISNTVLSNQKKWYLK